MYEGLHMPGSARGLKVAKMLQTILNIGLLLLATISLCAILSISALPRLFA